MSIAVVRGSEVQPNSMANVIDLNGPQAFPHLPVTSCVSQKIQSTPALKEKLNKTLFVFVQHLLETTGSLLVELNKCGIPFDNMIGKGKSYSTCQFVANRIKEMGVNLVEDCLDKSVRVGCYRQLNGDALDQLWKQVITHLEAHAEVKNIIILDEGGRCVERMPKELEKKYCVSAIEQTRGGLYSPALKEVSFPITLVATSAVKQKLESDLIANVILRKLEILICNRRIPNDASCGVIGNGAIGKAVAKYLINAKLDVVVYDANPNSFSDISSDKFTRVGSLDTLLSKSQVIFGCTGKDALSQVCDISRVVREDKFFISCSSEDREFYALLQLSNRKQCWLDDVVIETNTGKRITILNGGFPINFDCGPVSVPSEGIDLTRALLLGSIAQTISYQEEDSKQNPSFLMLSPVMQKFIANKWLYSEKFMLMYPKRLLGDVDSLSWIKQNSGGIYRQMNIENIFYDDDSYLMKV